MEEGIENIIHLKRHLNSIEHMIYVSCKFTRTTEMLRKVMETIVTGYENFFMIAFEMFSSNNETVSYTVHHKIQLLSDELENKGIHIDLSDYFLLKRLLISDFDSIGEYRKNLCMVSYIDGEEYVINMPKLLEFYGTLKIACTSLQEIEA
jgi:hypothetical protein